MEDRVKDEMETISELVEDAGVFDSKGFSTVKVTKEGVEKPLPLPIKSTGVHEYQSDLSNKAPRPPVKKELIKKKSDEGKALGLPHDQFVMMFDLTDESYIDEQEKHIEDFNWRVAVFALDLTWKKKDGSFAESYEDKKKILQSNGITGHQINRIFSDVQALTQFAEDREDFLSGS